MPALDGLRGLAILLVLAIHTNIFVAFGSSRLGEAAHQLAGIGWIGVDLFFVLSGFLITGILLSTRSSPTYYKSFFARRFLRIFPLYYLFLSILLLRYHRLYTGSDIASLLLYYYNLHAVVIDRQLPGVNSFWSLAIEEQFYLVWPFVVAFASEKALKRICLAGIIIALGLRVLVAPHAGGVDPAYLLTPCHVDGLLMGALLAIWKRDPVVWRRAYRLSVPLMLVCATAATAMGFWAGHFFIGVTERSLGTYRHSSQLISGPGITLVGLFFAALLVKGTHQGTVQKFFLSWPLRRIGKYSYGMYMLHWTLLLALRYVITRTGKGNFSGPVAALVLYLLLVGVSFVGAFLSFNLFEKHFLSLKRFFPAVEPAEQPSPLIVTTS